MPTNEDLVRVAVERLSEDEALRGDLSDEGFRPLLDWGVAAVQAYAAGAPDAAAMERYTGTVRAVIRAAVGAAEAGQLQDDPGSYITFETGRKDEAVRELAALSLGGDPDQNAARIAAVLQAALRPPTPAKSSRTKAAAPKRPRRRRRKADE